MNNRETNHEVIGTLNSLIETCKDGEQGFRLAGDSIQTPEIRTLFHMYAQQRAHFASDLNNEVLRHGGEPVSSGHVSASLHRGWLDLKSTIAGKHDAAIIEECSRGEKVAMAAYEEALKLTLPSDLFAIVEEQYAAIRHAHDAVHALHHAAHAQ